MKSRKLDNNRGVSFHFKLHAYKMSRSRSNYDPVLKTSFSKKEVLFKVPSVHEVFNYYFACKNSQQLFIKTHITNTSDVSPLTCIELTRLKGFSPEHKKRLWKLFNNYLQDFWVRADKKIRNLKII